MGPKSDGDFVPPTEEDVVDVYPIEDAVEMINRYRRDFGIDLLTTGTQQQFRNTNTKEKTMKAVGEIVTIVTMMGEVVGRLKEETSFGYVLESPRLFVPAQGEAAGGFAPGLSMTGVQNPKEGTINKQVALTVCITHQQVADGWTEATSGIVLP